VHSTQKPTLKKPLKDRESRGIQKPIIAAADGLAYGGGYEITMVWKGKLSKKNPD
jgi:1,4-dihydroxy-2-naphthoyl-CoA synthase